MDRTPPFRALYGPRGPSVHIAPSVPPAGSSCATLETVFQEPRASCATLETVFQQSARARRIGTARMAYSRDAGRRMNMAIETGMSRGDVCAGERGLGPAYFNTDGIGFRPNNAFRPGSAAARNRQSRPLRRVVGRRSVVSCGCAATRQRRAVGAPALRSCWVLTRV